jgi:hypothetical protein
VKLATTLHESQETLTLSRIDTVKESYEKAPLTWNVSMTTLISGAIVAIGFFVATQFDSHSGDADAHPDIRAGIEANGEQLNRIEANQVAQLIEKLDERICDDRNNRDLLTRMRELLAKYKTLSGEDFPAFLLKCANS